MECIDAQVNVHEASTLKQKFFYGIFSIFSQKFIAKQLQVTLSLTRALMKILLLQPAEASETRIQLPGLEDEVSN